VRRPIERLAWHLSSEDGEATLGALARKYGETTERIMDALDSLKMRRGEPTSLPPVDWSADDRV
jgi:hypothetical protein